MIQLSMKFVRFAAHTLRSSTMIFTRYAKTSEGRNESQTENCIAHYDVTALIGEGGDGPGLSGDRYQAEPASGAEDPARAFATDPDRLARFEPATDVITFRTSST